MKFILVFSALLAVASTDARLVLESSKSRKRLNELEAQFPCLGPLVNKTVVDQYTEKPNTALFVSGLISEVNGGIIDRFTLEMQMQDDFKISKPEAKKICATKCTNVLESCTIFELLEGINEKGEINYICYFYGDDSIASQAPVENPVKSNPERAKFNITSIDTSVFYIGEDLFLPEFVGCDVPVGADITTAVQCLSNNTFSEDCGTLLGNLTSDFGDYILPAVLCTNMEVGELNAIKCLDCLVNDAFLDCSGKQVCEEAGNIITTKCPDTCTSTGEVQECKTCGNYCPQEDTCVAKLATGLLCSIGARPKFDSEGQLGGCLNADNAAFPEAYLAEKGNGDFKCLNKTAIPVWVE